MVEEKEGEIRFEKEKAQEVGVEIGLLVDRGILKSVSYGPKLGECECKKGSVEAVVGGRYGYSAVDLKCKDDKTGVVLETIIAGVTKKEANIIAGAINSALHGDYDRRGAKFCKREG